jgi:phage I-like protein
MTRSSFPPDVALGAVTLDVSGAAAPEWVKVTPRGSVVTRDGRSYRFDPEKLLARFAADGVDIPVDLDHAISRKTTFGERADAVGWVKELHSRADGLYARVEWLKEGLDALAARTHRFISPTFRHDDSGSATWLHSVALVAAPALAMPALAAALGAGIGSPSALLPIDPTALAAAAHDFCAARAAQGRPICFADAVLAVSQGRTS